MTIAHAQNKTVSGYVRDQTGSAVAGAKVVFSTPLSETLSSATDENGYFRIENVTVSSGHIVVSVSGFQTFVGEWTGQELNVILRPAVISEQVTVIRPGSRLGDTPQSVVLLDDHKLRSDPAVTVDDKLRQVPGFTLFRRSGSRTANPTSQGVSLRGTGASGASRAVVLFEGTPLNDPFGGWIFWGRVPIESISEVEILRGAAGDLFGSSAIGGVIAISRRPASTKPAVDLEASYGSQNTPLASLFASGGRGRVKASLAAEGFATDGFILVPKEQRGDVDTQAGSRRTAFAPEIEFDLNRSHRLFAAFEYFEERRANGTPLQTNDTKIISGRIGGDFVTERFGTFAVRSWLMSERYHQSFSSVSADRNSETLTRLQTVPSRSAGISTQWSRAFSAQTTVFVGAEARFVQGSSDEVAFAAGRPTSFVNAGGREFTFGTNAGLNFTPFSRIILSAAIRYDRWREYSAYSDTRPFTGTITSRSTFVDRAESAVSPRLALLYRLSDHLSVTGTFSTGFRQPTLNELYRSFRVGNVLTLANASLTAEHADSGEVGIVANGFGNRLYVRAVGFCNEITRPVANVTLTVTPSLITRQRQNLGRTRGCGIEADSQYRVGNDLEFSAGYLFVDARVASFPADRTLEGLRIPQVARNQFTLQTRYSNPKIADFSIQLRTSDAQFDDDQNLFRLAGFAAVDISASRRINRSLQVFAAAENIFNDRIEAGRTPVVTLTGPRTIRIGLRFELGRK